MKYQVGRPIPRTESADKVAGTAEYIHNLELAGMLHGKIVRSVLAHARITGIDTGEAERQPGVSRVITAADVGRVAPDPYHGPAFHDQPVLAVDRVRHAGEPVAVVLADDPHAAAAAAELVEVDYDELPAVFDEVEAAAADAVIVHDELRPSATFTDLAHLAGRRGTNVAVDYRLRHGDVEEGFARADRVYEHTFRTPAVAHAALEPIVAAAELGDNGTLIVHSSTQNPSFVRAELARLFGMAENRVRVRTAFLGGGFGAKLYVKLEPIVAASTLLTRVPVKISLSMDEQFFTITRHASTIRIRTGVSDDGRIRARDVRVWWNGGAYADIGPRVTQKSGATAAGPYDIEHVSVDSRAVYTNLPPAGAMRGFGIPQVVWAYESQSDIIARDLGIDPVEFRRRNLLRTRRPHATGTLLEDAGTEEVLEELARQMRWDRPITRGDGPLRRGRGVAFALKAVATPSTSVATVSLGGDGGCVVSCATVDMGQGSDTVMAQIAGEVLGIPAERIRVVHPDTDATPYDMGTLGSRSTYHMGNAVQAASEQVRQQLLGAAASLLGSDVDSLDVHDEHVLTQDGSKKLAFGDIMTATFGMRAGNLFGSFAFTPPYTKPDPNTGQSDNITAFWMVGGAGAEVQVDTETGEVAVTRVVVVGDVGRALNPAAVRTQLSGGAVMQLGMTMSEELRYEDGQLVNPGLGYYKIPGMLDVPADIETVVVEVPARNGPFGAKGAGETGTFALSPAVANAVHDAVGVRISQLPVTAEKVLQALRAGAGHPLEDR